MKNLVSALPHLSASSRNAYLSAFYRGAFDPPMALGYLIFFRHIPHGSGGWPTGFVCGRTRWPLKLKNKMNNHRFFSSIFFLDPMEAFEKFRTLTNNDETCHPPSRFPYAKSSITSIYRIMGEIVR